MSTIEEDVERVRAVADALGAPLEIVYVVVCEWDGIGTDVYLSKEGALAAVKASVLARIVHWDEENRDRALAEFKDNNFEHWNNEDDFSVLISQEGVRP